MSDSYVQLPTDGSSKKNQTVSNTVNSQTVHGHAKALTDKTAVHLLAPGGTEVGEPLCGTVTHADTDAGSPIKLGGVYNSSAPSLTNGQRSDAQVDISGNLRVNDQAITETTYTYSVTVTGLAPAASATDIFEFNGSSFRRVQLRRLEVSGTAGTATTVDALLIRRSSGDSGGTSALLTSVSMDSSDTLTPPVIPATHSQYTANPTVLGTTVGTVRSGKLHLPLATSRQPPVLVWEFGAGERKAMIERGGLARLALNLGEATVSSGSINITAEWTEVGTDPGF